MAPTEHAVNHAKPLSTDAEPSALVADLTRSRLARIALAAWVNVDPDKLPPEKAWIEHPNDDNRQAWERVVAAIALALSPPSKIAGEG